MFFAEVLTSEKRPGQAFRHGRQHREAVVPAVKEAPMCRKNYTPQRAAIRYLTGGL